MSKVNILKKSNIRIAAIVIFSSSISMSCQSKKAERSRSASSKSTDMQLQRASGTRLQLVQQVEQIKSSISLRYNELQAQRDRQGKITSELLNQTNQGCFANMKIDKLEILVKGSWLGRKGLGETKDPMSSEAKGNPFSVTFQFGEQLAVVNDEQSQSLFQQAGRKVVTEFADLKLSDIEFIRIAKGGAEYDSERVCKRSGFLGTSEKCRYQNYEESRLELDSIELKINGETFYKRDAIQFQFEEGTLEWRDDSLLLNEAYLSLMGREDCPQG
ncbi:MAG: hypothetical protein R3B45_08600 [Bdellovibrionota bacterium]